MTDPARRSLRHTVAAACAAAGLTVVLAAFSFTASNGLPPGHHPMRSTPTPRMPPMSSMPGMGTMDGLAAEYNGYAMASGTATLLAGKFTDYGFTITGPDGKPVTN